MSIAGKHMARYWDDRFGLSRRCTSTTRLQTVAVAVVLFTALRPVAGLCQFREDAVSTELWSEPVPIFETTARAPCYNSLLKRLIVNAGGYVSHYDSASGLWTEPTPPPLAPGFPQNVMDYATLSPDGRRMYGEMWNNANGSWDLYVSQWSDTQQVWLVPENLGPKINTPGADQFAVEVGAAGKRRLYVVTYGPGNSLYYDWDSAKGGWGQWHTVPTDSRTAPGPAYGMSMTADGRRFYYGADHHHPDKTGNPRDPDLYVCYCCDTAGRFIHCGRLSINASPPETVAVGYYWNFCQDWYPSVSADGQYLFFESSRDLTAPRTGYAPPPRIYVSHLIHEATDSDLNGVHSPRLAVLARSFAFTVSPQPADAFIEARWEGSEDQRPRIILANITGKVLASARMKAGSLVRIDASRYVPGPYVLSITCGAQTERRLILVVH